MASSNSNDNTRLETDQATDTGITAINNDSEVLISTKNNEVDFQSTYKNATHGAAPQEIRDFLKRPRQIATGSWSNASSSPLATIQIPLDILNSNVFAQKVQGFLGFRAKAIIRVQLNANRFQQGRLILHHVPYGVTASSAPALWSGWKGALTQHPNAQMDANCDTEMVLEVPYVSSFLAYDLQDGNGSSGTVYLSIYSPLNYASGSTTAEYTIWGSFEDVELFGPTLQSTYVPQSGKGLAPNAKEVKAEGIISGAASAISAAGKALNKSPLLSPFGGITTWFSDLVAMNAKAFGYSKPNIVNAAMRMRQENAPYHNNADAPEACNIMSVFADNSVAQLPVGRADLDELDIQYLASRPSFYFNFNWTTSQDTGTVVYTTDVQPINFSVTHTDTGTGPSQAWQEQTPLSFVGNLFQYWRGSIRFTFKFPKTEFHSGRLVATFVPSANYAGAAPSINDGTYLMREIFDMRMANEFTVLVPYTSTRPFLDTIQTMGRLYVTVLNELVAPATVASSIDVLVEVSGGPDIEFAGPQYRSFVPYIPLTYTVQSGSGLESLPIIDEGYESDDEYVEQSGPGMKSNPCALVDSENAIGGGNIVSDSHTSSLYCIGEKITSLRQLLKRRSRIYTTSAPVSSLEVDPFFNQWCSYSATTGLVEPIWYGDLIGTLKTMFGFSRGGVRLYVYDNDKNTTIGSINAYYNAYRSDPYLKYDSFSNQQRFYDAQGWVSHSIQHSGIAEFQCPMYHKFHARTNIQVGTEQTYSGELQQPYRLKVDFRYNINQTEFTAARAAADDYDLNFFISIPPLMLMPHG